MNESMLLTVCIVHYRKLPQLKKTVDDLRKNTSIKFKLKILNNGFDGDGIREYLADLGKLSNVEVIMYPDNIGCSPGRRILSQDITTPFIMMLDDDMYVNKGWDIPIFKKFQEDKDIGAIGFSIYKVDGSFWWTGGRNLKIVNNTVCVDRPKVIPETSSIDFIEVDDVAAGAMVYRKELEDIIRWDEAYFIGFEDLEKGLDLKASNYKCLVSVKSKFIHDKVSEDSNQKTYNQARRNYHAYRRSYLYFMKNNKVRLPLFRHIFYKYVCLLPNSILQKVVYFWLGLKR